MLELDNLTDYKSTSKIARDYNLIASEFIAFLESSKLIYRHNKSLRLSQEAIKLGGTYRINGSNKWIIWPKNSLNKFIDKFKTKDIDKLEIYNIQNFYHMTHIDNLENILKFGLLPNGNNYQKINISDNDVNSRRTRNEPIYNKKIHTYVPLYFNPKNAMLYKRKDFQSEIIVFALKKELILNPEIVFTDGNASCATTKFFKNIEDLNQLDWQCIKGNNWIEFVDGRRKKMAEILIPKNIDISNIEYIICNNIFVKNKINEILKKIGQNIEIINDIHKKIFF